MTTYQLAKRMGVNQSRIIKLEQATENHTVKLETLERVAEALECKLVFALVPKTSLKDIVETQAHEKAKKRVQYVSHSMDLEDQKASQEDVESDIEELAQSLIDRSGNKLWSNE